MRISRTLVASEIALSLMLLIGAGLLLRSFWHLLDVRPGFDANRVVITKLWLAVPNDPKQDPYQTVEKRAAFHEEVLRRIRAIPGVEMAAVSDSASLPMSDRHFQLGFTIEGKAEATETAPVAEVSVASAGFFDTLRTPLVAGRLFTQADNSKGQPVVIINETLARKYWANGDAVGQHIRFNAQRRDSQPQPSITIIGIVSDIKSEGLDAAVEPRIYRPMYQVPTYDGVVYVRSGIDPGTLGNLIRREVQSIDPGIPVFGIRTMTDVVKQFLAQRTFALELLGLFASVALLLATIGIYGVMAYTFSRRTNEIGIRLAMGAQRSDILKIALGEGAFIVFFGLVGGVLGALLLTRFLQTMLFDVKPTDPLTFLAISALLAGAAMLACFVPARRTTRVDPLVALRHE